MSYDAFAVDGAGARVMVVPGQHGMAVHLLDGTPLLVTWRDTGERMTAFKHKAIEIEVEAWLVRPFRAMYGRPWRGY